MKKIIAFVLICVMCLGITACASEEEKLYEKYEDIIEALEDEDYEEAYKEIIKLYNKSDKKEEEESKNNKKAEEYKKSVYGKWYGSINDNDVVLEITKDGVTVSGKAYTVKELDAGSSSWRFELKDGDKAVYSIEFFGTGEHISCNFCEYSSDGLASFGSSLMSESEYNEIEAANEAARSKFYGEWYIEIDDEISILDFSKDSVTVFGTEYTWKTGYVYENSVEIDVMDGDTKKYRLYFDEESSSSFYEFYGEEESDYDWKCYIYSADKYTKHEITIDNWEEYFELKENVQVDKDSFGDPSQMYVTIDLLLKESYGEVLGNLSNVALEYTIKQHYFHVYGDLNAGTYTLGEKNDDYEYEYTYTDTMSMWNITEDLLVYGECVFRFYIDEFPEDYVTVMADFNVDRIVGVIFTENAE